MVSAPLIGVMQKLHPYFSLLHVDFFKDELGYIACVTNPIFLQSTQWYDICCEIDVGKIRVQKNKDFYNYEQQKYHALDMSFIRPLIARIKDDSINDEEIKKAFESYTLLHLDLALHSDEGLKPSQMKGASDDAYKIEDLTHENEKLWDILLPRI